MLWTMKDAEAKTGIPATSFQRAADEHGMLIRMGRAVRFDPDDLKELLKKCQGQAKAPASTSEKTERGPSSTARSSAARALLIADELKKRSRNTSASAGGQVVPLNQGK